MVRQFLRRVLRRFSFVRALEETIVHLEYQLDRALAGELTIEKMVLGRGGFTAELGTEMGHVLAESFGALLLEMNAGNFVELRFATKAGQHLTVTVQKQDGKTPYELMAEAQAEVQRLRAQHRHCELCGGTWLEDGINTACYCGGCVLACLCWLVDYGADLRRWEDTQ